MKSALLLCVLAILIAWSSAVQQDSAPQAISSLLRSFSESAKAGKPLDRYLAPSLSGLHQRERVAALRRDLPEGAPIQDYEFEEGPRDLNAGDAPVRTVRLSELFTKPNRSLVIYHFMFGKKQTKACPMCTAWLDSANGVAHHLAQNLDFAVVAAADLPTLRAHARERGWDKLRLLSAGNNTFKYDLGSEDDAGGQDSTVSVFTRDAKGTLRHFYTAHPRMAPDIQERGIDLLTPIWHFMDLTPQGRGSWYAGLAYGTKAA